MDKEIFTLISLESEIKKIWTDLAYYKCEIICKGDNENVVKLRARIVDESNKTIECSFDPSTPIKNGEPYLGHFTVNGEKYYFKSNFQINKTSVFIPAGEKIYRLQRRQNYRVKIPDSRPMFLELIFADSHTEPLKMQLLDLSSQGCRVSFKDESNQISEKNLFSGSLVLHTGSKIPVQGEIRHIQLDSKKPGLKTFGILFTPISAKLENQLFAITMETYKTFFRKSL